MEKRPPKSVQGRAPASRADRLKEALKANLQRRKAQAKARAGEDGKPGTEPGRKG